MRIRLPFANSPHRHLGLPIYTASILGGSVLHWWLGDGALGLIARSATTALMVLGILFWGGHSGGSLCETCVEQMPLDAGEQAERRGSWLRHHHRLYDNRTRAIAVFAGLMAFLAITSYAGGLTEQIYSTLFNVWILVDFWSSEIHKRLSPWCPQCRDDGGDNDEAVAPTPSTPQTA